MLACYLDLKSSLSELSGKMEALCSPGKLTEQEEEELSSLPEFRKQCENLPRWIARSRERIAFLLKLYGRKDWYDWPAPALSEIGSIALQMMVATLPGAKGDLEGVLVFGPMGDGEILELSWKWAMVAAQCGCAMGELGAMVLLGRMQPYNSGRFLWEAFESWENRFQGPDYQFHFAGKMRKDLCWDLTCELGLQAALQLRDPAMATRVVHGFCMSGAICLPLSPLYFQVARLCQQDAEAVKPATKRILVSITPGQKKEDQDQLDRYRPLLRPIPLSPWPGTRDWADVLRKEFPWMREAVDTLERQQLLGFRLGRKTLGIRPLLLLGPAGVGKTRFLRRLGEVWNLPAAFLPLAGISDNLLLKGLARGWSGARAGYLAEQFLNFGVANPLVILDEIDKIGTARQNGRVWETLLTMLEPASSTSVLDEFLIAPVDCSAVNWVATANSLEEVPRPLRSRWEIVWSGEPQGDAFDEILENLLQEISKENGVAKTGLPQLDNRVVGVLRRSFQKNPQSIRVLRRILYRMMELEAMAAAEMAEKQWLQ